MTSELFILAKIGLGVFKNERTIEVRVNDKLYSGIVDKKDVIYEGELQPGKTIDGKVRVYPIERDKERVLINFPRGTINGQRTWVFKRFLYE